jgi:hypothetical protein
MASNSSSISERLRSQIQLILARRLSHFRRSLRRNRWRSSRKTRRYITLSTSMILSKVAKDSIHHGSVSFTGLTPQTIAIFTGKDREIINIRDLDIVSSSIQVSLKSGGFVVTGMDWRQRVFTLASLPLEMKPPELTDLVFKSVVRGNLVQLLSNLTSSCQFSSTGGCRR